MLDDLKMIHYRDPQDCLGIIAKQPSQLRWKCEFVAAGIGAADISNIVFVGMGSMALAAEVARIWLGLERPFEVVRSYDLPAYVGPGTLVIAASYSGATEEVLSALGQAARRGAHVVAMAAGGAMAELVQSAGGRFVTLPDGAQPRFAGWYVLKALAGLLDSLGLTRGRSAELAAEAGWLETQIAAWLPDAAGGKNPAKQLALELMGKSVVVYAGPLMAPVAYSWKTAINQNAKQIAWWGQYPEFNHNEFAGWTKQPVQKPYAVVDIRSGLEHERIGQRFEMSGRLLSGLRPPAAAVDMVGDSLLRQLLYGMALGDFVSVYLALLSNVNPMPLEIVDKLKKELA